MSFSEHALKDLQKDIERAVLKFLGHKDPNVINTCLKCATRGYDRNKTRDRLGEVMDDHKAHKFADKLMIMVDDFRSNIKKSRKRRDDDHDHTDSDRKRNRTDEIPVSAGATLATTAALNAAALKAVVKDAQETNNGADNVGQNYPIVSPGMLTTAKIKEMMANAQRTIAQRKQELGLPEPSPMPESTDPSEMLKRSSELQAQIAARMASSGLMTGFTSGISTPGIQTPSAKPKEALNRHVIIDEQGRTVDALTGEVIQLTQHTPTLKANLRAKRGEQLKQELQTKKTTYDLEESEFYDPRIAASVPARTRRQFRFHEQGKFIKQAQILRSKAQLQRLKDSVDMAAKRTGIESAAKLAAIQPRRMVDETNLPEIEWWDVYLLNTATMSYAELDGDVPVESLINQDWITNLIEHPIKLKSQAESELSTEIPLLLVKRERRKLRRQNRLEAQKEEQEKVRLGLRPPAEPKVRMSNLMRVLGTEAVQDPTKIEARVRAQIEKRRKQHEAANAARKLTKDQTRYKKIKKLKEDTSHGVHVAVYRVKDMGNASHKFKVETNCTQLYMTGFVALHRDCNVVVVEGGPKQQKKFKRLMLSRIRWHEGRRGAVQTEPPADSAGKRASDFCSLVWEGTVKQRAFDKIQFKACPSELFAREQFRKHDVEQYWDLSYSAAVLEAAGQEVA